jgi:hypothetical protein
MNDSVPGRLDALENAFIILVELLAEREVIDPSILRDLLSRRAERFRTDHGSATDPLGTAHALKLLAAGISSSTEWVRREHD